MQHDPSSDVRAATVLTFGHIMGSALSHRDDWVASQCFEMITDYVDDRDSAVQDALSTAFHELVEPDDLSSLTAEDLSATNRGRVREALRSKTLGTYLTSTKSVGSVLAPPNKHDAPTEESMVDGPTSQGSAEFYTLDEAAGNLDADEQEILHLAEIGNIELSGDPAVFSMEAFRQLAQLKLRKDIDILFDDPDVWLNSPNPQMSGAIPADLIGTEKEQAVIDIVESLKYGNVS